MHATPIVPGFLYLVKTPAGSRFIQAPDGFAAICTALELVGEGA